MIKGLTQKPMRLRLLSERRADKSVNSQWRDQVWKSMMKRTRERVKQMHLISHGRETLEPQLPGH